MYFTRAGFLFNFLIHGGGGGLVGVFVYLRDLHLQAAGAEGDLYDIAHLHLIARLYLPAVNAYALLVAGLVCNGAPLYQAGHF